jgi:hypothetical protein
MKSGGGAENVKKREKPAKAVRNGVSVSESGESEKASGEISVWHENENNEIINGENENIISVMAWQCRNNVSVIKLKTKIWRSHLEGGAKIANQWHRK